MLHGMLVIDKPAGWTSHDVCAWVRKWAGERKVGHAGTLDPAATGVLPVALNDGTRVLEFLTDADKAYEAEITFGIATDSCDIDGIVIEQDSVAVSLDKVTSALAQFTGTIEQVPPALSAIRINGHRAYDLVRAGETVDMPLRTVQITRIDVLGMAGTALTVAIECSKGTYIRSLARDLGRTLGTCAYLSNLVRTRSGPYHLADAWTLDELKMLDPVGEWPTIAEHPDGALAVWPSIVFDSSESADWLFGRQVASRAGSSQSRVRVYDCEGSWIGLAEMDLSTNAWKPLRVVGRP